MNKEDFQNIIEILTQKVKACDDHLGQILLTSDLENLTIAKAKDLREFCISELNDMNRICTAELYHIIGMGNLTSIQQSKFLKLLKEYLKYRSDMKTIAFNFVKFENIPNLPTYSEYILETLGKIKLTSEIRGGAARTYKLIDDLECEEDKNVVVKENKIYVKTTYAKHFLKSIYTKADNKMLDKLKKACEENKSYSGFIWARCSENVFEGLVDDTGMFNKVKTIYGGPSK